MDCEIWLKLVTCAKQQLIHQLSGDSGIGISTEGAQSAAHQLLLGHIDVAKHRFIDTNDVASVIQLHHRHRSEVEHLNVIARFLERLQTETRLGLAEGEDIASLSAVFVDRWRDRQVDQNWPSVRLPEPDPEAFNRPRKSAACRHENQRGAAIFQVEHFAKMEANGMFPFDACQLLGSGVYEMDVPFKRESKQGFVHTIQRR